MANLYCGAAMAMAMASTSATMLLTQPTSSTRITRSSIFPSGKPQIPRRSSVPVSQLKLRNGGLRRRPKQIGARVVAASGGAAEFPLEGSPEGNTEPTETPSPQEQEERRKDLTSWWKNWQTNASEMRAQVAKLGLAAVLAYGLFDGVTYTSFFVLAFLGYEKSTGQNPAANLKALLGTQVESPCQSRQYEYHASFVNSKSSSDPYLNEEVVEESVVVLMWTGNNVTRPLRVAGAAALAPLIDRFLKKTQEVLKLPNQAFAFMIVVASFASLCFSVVGILVLSRWGR